MNGDRIPYERLEDESSQAYEAFCTYRDLGAGRSLPKTAQVLGKKPGYTRQLGQWSSTYKWVERCVPYDTEKERERRYMYEQCRREEYMEKLAKYREINEKLGNELMNLGHELLKIVKETIKNIDLQDVKVSDLPGLARSAALLADIGSALVGQALGVEKLLDTLQD